MKTIRIKEVCQSCKGTGIYIGIAERDGFGVVCHSCGGTGCHQYEHQYEDFKKRKKTKKVIQVIKCNPGIVVGLTKDLSITDFGGMPYKDWIKNKPFPEKSEMRKFSCPTWWYQIANYELKPNWDECIFAGLFSDCKNFATKEKCWEKFDNQKK